VNAAHTKATRADWLRAALDVFTSSGVEHVKVQPLAAQLGVGRASFYWYFTDRAALLDELQQVWAGTNTASILDRSAGPADTITAAVLGLFECWSDPSLFDPKLDTAMRYLARTDSQVAAVVTAADERRLEALTHIFQRHRFAAGEAQVRARIVYYNQVGYYALGIRETMQTRLGFVTDYLLALTGQLPSAAELRTFRRFLRNVASPHGG